MNMQESAVSHKDKKDKKKKKKKDKKKSKKEKEEKYRTKSRAQYPFMPPHFINAFGPYGPGYHDDHGDLQDGNYQS